MTDRFVTATIDIHCDCQDTTPSYRVFVGQELFCERSWIWHGRYLREILQIKAPPGDYPVRLLALGTQQNSFRFSNPQIEQGSAEWLPGFHIRIPA